MQTDQEDVLIMVLQLRKNCPLCGKEPCDYEEDNLEIVIGCKDCSILMAEAIYPNE